MISAPKPINESERLSELYSYDILDTEDEKEFDDLAQLASDICGTPIALISLIDPDRQWFKSKVGIDAAETSRDIAFCAHAILQDDIFEIEDTLLDERFADNPLVTDAPNIRFYAGTPLITPRGYALGTLCAISDTPKKLSNKQRRALDVLGNEVVSRLELKRTIKALESANKFKSMFLSNVSHEIRTPMNGVIGLTQLLLGTPLNEQQREYTHSIQRSGESLLRIINDVLDLSKIESGKLDIETIQFDVDDIITDAIHCFKHQASGKALALSCDLSPQDSLYKGDPFRIRQVLNNLVGNAIKFTENGSVTVSYEVMHRSEKESVLRVSVKDTGIGISSEQQSLLFKRFNQADSSTTRKYGGTGLGLSISKELVELMGGEIGLTSLSGEGTEFWFSLSLGKSCKKEPLGSKDTEELPETFDSKVLIVEDNRVNQVVAKGMLEKLGIEVELAENGALAIAMMRNTAYDLILMDCQMPVMDGFEAVKHIRSHDSFVKDSFVPVVAMTANAMAEDQKHCLDSGMDDYLSKPLSFERLHQVLTKWLAPQNKKEGQDDSLPKTSPLNVCADEFSAALKIKAFDKQTIDSLKLEKRYLSNVLNVFWETTPREIECIAQALEQKDLARVRTTAHAIKGSSSMLGASRLSAVAAYIESRAMAGTPLPAAPMIDQLNLSLAEFTDAISAEL